MSKKMQSCAAKLVIRNDLSDNRLKSSRELQWVSSSLLSSP